MDKTIRALTYGITLLGGILLGNGLDGKGEHKQNEPVNSAAFLRHGEFKGFSAYAGINEKGFRYIKLIDTTSFLSSRGYIPAQLEWILDREGHPINQAILHPAVDIGHGQIPFQESNPLLDLANAYDMETAYEQITRNSR